MGVISAPGVVFQITLNHARKLISTDNKFLSELGKKIKFEITIGVNGKIW
jgi:exosome complex RNA-binding protein Rrp4